MKPFTIGFGLIQMTQQQIKELQDELEEFHKSPREAVFVIFVGALNHWVTFIVHKRVAKKPDLEFDWVRGAQTIDPEDMEDGAEPKNDTKQSIVDRLKEGFEAGDEGCL